MMLNFLPEDSLHEFKNPFTKNSSKPPYNRLPAFSNQLGHALDGQPRRKPKPKQEAPESEVPDTLIRGRARAASIAGRHARPTYPKLFPANSVSGLVKPPLSNQPISVFLGANRRSAHVPSYVVYKSLTRPGRVMDLPASASTIRG